MPEIETCTGTNSSTRTLPEKLKTRPTRPEFLETCLIPTLLSVVNTVQNLIAVLAFSNRSKSFLKIQSYVIFKDYTGTLRLTEIRMILLVQQADLMVVYLCHKDHFDLLYLSDFLRLSTHRYRTP